MTPARLAIFCSWPGRPDRLDESWTAEAEAATAAGFNVALIDHDSVIAGKLSKAVARVASAGEPVLGVYRGWMLTVEQYARLYEALEAKGVELINDPEEYAACHHLPGWYENMESHTPASRWIPHAPPFSHEELVTALAGWTGPAIIKDYVKSEKHAWLEACFIPDVTNVDHVARVVARFVELRGSDFAGGLVFREFVKLKSCGTHPQSGMPLSNEWRVFWHGGDPIACSPYWDTPGVAAPELINFQHLAQVTPSTFFAMDLAQRDDGSWIVLELGDGQVSGLPDLMPPHMFYRSLRGTIG